MKEWKGLIAGLLLGVFAMLAIGAATMDSNGRYQFEVIVWREHGRDQIREHVKECMLDTRTGDLYEPHAPRLGDKQVWYRTCAMPRDAKPDTDSAE